MSDDGQYRGRVIVITAASGGFGPGTALALARRGCSVVLGGPGQESLTNLARECVHAGGQALAVPVEIFDRAAFENLARRAVERFGHFDVWINDAGVTANSRSDQVPREDPEQVIRTNLLGTVLGSQSALEHFRERNAGILINIAPAVGKLSSTLLAACAAAKFGVVGLCDALRQQLRQEHVESIRVCAVMPLTPDSEPVERAGKYNGRNGVPAPPSYDPRVTIDMVVRLVIEPRDEVVTGLQGESADFLHQLMPDAVEKLMASKAKAHLQNGASQNGHSGSIICSTVHAPARGGMDKKALARRWRGDPAADAGFPGFVLKDI